MARKKKPRSRRESLNAAFERYWRNIKVELAKRDREANPKKREKLELRIHYRRSVFLMKPPDRSRFIC